MPKLQILGTVLPEELGLNMPFRGVSWRDPETGFRTTFHIHIVASILNIECDSDFTDDKYIDIIMVNAFQLARTEVDLAVFASGIGLSIILNTLIKEDGIPLRIRPENPRLLGNLCTAYNLGPLGYNDFDQIYRLISTNDILKQALNDLSSTLTTYFVQAPNCGRAMDGIKHLIADPNAKEPQAWQQMREALNIERDYVQFISDNSKQPRHGKPSVPSILAQTCAVVHGSS
jgi:hypothetical protein